MYSLYRSKRILLAHHLILYETTIENHTKLNEFYSDNTIKTDHRRMKKVLGYLFVLETKR